MFVPWNVFREWRQRQPGRWRWGGGGKNTSGWWVLHKYVAAWFEVSGRNVTLFEGICTCKSTTCMVCSHPPHFLQRQDVAVQWLLPELEHFRRSCWCFSQTLLGGGGRRQQQSNLPLCVYIGEHTASKYPHVCIMWPVFHFASDFVTISWPSVSLAITWPTYSENASFSPSWPSPDQHIPKNIYFFHFLFLPWPSPD